MLKIRDSKDSEYSSVFPYYFKHSFPIPKAFLLLKIDWDAFGVENCSRHFALYCRVLAVNLQV